jgi:hypothetical protein
MRLTKTHRQHLRALLHPEARLVIVKVRASSGVDHRNARGQVWWLYPRGLAGGDPRRLCGRTPDAIEHTCTPVLDSGAWIRVANVEGGKVWALTQFGKELLRARLRPKNEVVWRRKA